MFVTDLVVEVRDSTLARVGQIRPVDLVDFTAVLRFQEVGTWSIPIRADNVLADALRAPGAGIIVNGPGFSFSGPTSSAKLSQSQTDPVGTWEISGLTDDVILGERIAYPTPTTADLSLQVDEFDTRTGVASTVIIGYVDANIGPSAPTARKIASLSLAADPNVGSTITANAKFDSLGSLIKKLSAIDALGFTVRQVGDGLEFLVYAPTDRSSTIRMDVDNNLLAKSEYTYSAPTATRVIVAGSGSGTSRAFQEVTTSLSSAAETAWGRRIELFKDDRSNTSSEALTQTGETELADKGKTLEAISVTPTDDTTMEYGLDWNLGDKVSVVVGSETISQIVTEVGIKVSEDGIRVGATVGLPAVADEDSAVVETQTDQESRISNLERNTTASGGSTSGTLPTGGTDGQILAKASATDYDTEWIDNFAAQIKHEVKLGESIAKGQAVYVSSANGTNMIVSKASNGSEATSSKTMGLLETGGATNDFVKVVTEGLLAGLNTSAATAGDPVWLGTSGNLLYGLANKPVAPAHMVAIGIVTRSHSNQGEIFVKVQNGFELDELHNVLLTSVADDNLLAYDSASSLWKNQTAAQVGVAALSGATFTGPVIAQSLRSSFASASARNSAIPSPTEGMLCWLEDVNQVTVYLGGTSPTPGAGWYPVAGQMPFFDVLKTANQTGVVSSSITLVTWPTAITNRGGFTVASNAVTVPLTGLYSINAAVAFDSGNTAGNNRHTLIYVNGAAITRDGSPPTQTVDATTRSFIKTYLTAGDVVDVRAYQTSGSNMSIISTRTRFTISYEGP